ncbi:MAG: hypothetical protein ACRDIB_02925, partial [Ardenticatenaceae bacterium]
MSKPPRKMAGILVVVILVALIPLSALAAGPYSGQIVQRIPNCGLTQIFGTVLDSAGNPKSGVRVRVTWQDGSAETVSGSYVRPETNASGWDFTLDSRAKAGTWQVMLVDESGNLLSEPLTVFTTDVCSGPDAANAVKVEFREGAGTPAPPAPPPAPGGGGTTPP